MKRIIISLIFVSLIIISLEGCAYITHYKELTLLKRFADSRSEIENYVKRQEELFYKLGDDIKNKRLSKGISQDKILAAYGEPIFCKKEEHEAGSRETCLYRHPTRYFFSDKIYLAFDINQCLDSWELIKTNN